MSTMESEWLTFRQAQLATEGWNAQHVAQLAAEQAKTEKAIEALSALAQRLEAPGPASQQAVVAAASPEGRMKPVNLPAQLAAAETELACLKLVLAQVRQDRDGLRQDRDVLRQERDGWQREAEKLYDYAAKLREVDERRFAPMERRPWWRLVG
jgi:hypothetical protein